MKKLKALFPVVVVIGVLLLVFSSMCSMPTCPEGHECVLVAKSVIFGSGFGSVIQGPRRHLTWPGRTYVAIDRRPATYTEKFEILASDELRIVFNAHVKISVKEGSARKIIEDYGDMGKDGTPAWYTRFIKEEFRTYVRDTVKDYAALEVKNKAEEIGNRILEKLKTLTRDTPFVVYSVVVGNIEYPEQVTQAVERKIAAQQELEKKFKELEIARKEAEIRIEEAKGIAKSQEIINATLTPEYLQFMAIKNMETVASSPNTTIIYVPIGETGLPLRIMENRNMLNQK